jgi:type I restriction enzyme, R subunit
MYGLTEIQQSIINDVESLPLDSEYLLPYLDDIEKFLEPNFWYRSGEDPQLFIKQKIIPLMRFKENVNLKSASFVLKCEQLILSKLLWGHATEWWNDEGPKKLIDDIKGSISRIEPSLDQVLPKKELYDLCLDTRNNFWEDISFEKIIQIRDEFSPLMHLQQSQPVQTVVIRMNDVIQDRGIVRYGPDSNSMNLLEYREKVEKKIKELAESNTVLLKIKNNEVVTEDDIDELSEILMSSELGINTETLSIAFNTSKQDIVTFVQSILGLIKLPNKNDMIEEAFSGFLLKRNFTADQINFFRILESHFIEHNSIKFENFYEPPFSILGKPVTDYFQKNELLELTKLCKELEKEICE